MKVLLITSLLWLSACGEDPARSSQAGTDTATPEPLAIEVTACGIRMIEKGNKVYPALGDTPLADGVYSLSGWGINCRYEIKNGTVKEI